MKGKGGERRRTDEGVGKMRVRGEEGRGGEGGNILLQINRHLS